MHDYSLFSEFLYSKFYLMFIVQHGCCVVAYLKYNCGHVSVVGINGRNREFLKEWNPIPDNEISDSYDDGIICGVLCGA